MKKVIIAVAMLASCLAANAQDPAVAPAAKLYKPVAGDVLAELGFFAGGITGTDAFALPKSTFGTPQLKFRYFLQDKIAIRAGINYSQNASNTKIYQGGGGSGTGSAKTSNSLCGINVGLEKHFAGTGRLSTYAGADVSMQFISAGYKWENTLDGTTYTADVSTKARGTSAPTGGVKSSFGFGLRAVTGADYYFVDKVYLGAEMGWGFMALTDGKTKTETTAGGTTTTVDTKSGGSSFQLAPMVTAGLRIGYRF